MHFYSALLLFFALYTTINATPIENVPYNIVGNLSPTQSSEDSFTLPEHCKLPRDLGYGSKPHLHWYFDVNTNACEELYYNGQGGNANFFDTERDCLLNCTADPCKKVIINGSKLGALLVDGKHEQCSYNQTTKQDNCPKDYYCSLYAEVCCPQESNDVCSMSMIEGSKPYPHSEHRQFFYYNQENEKCEPFYYNGVGGNSNRFVKRSECELACVKQVCPEKHPHSKLHGPVVCEVDGEDNVCPNDYNCVLTTESSLSLCCPLVKLPSDNLKQSMPGSTSSSNNFNTFSMAIFFSILFIMYL